MTPEEAKILETTKEVVASYRKWQGSIKTVRITREQAHDILLKHGEDRGHNMIGETAVDAIRAREDFFAAVRELDKVVPKP